jgi:hypothetical protein
LLISTWWQQANPQTQQRHLKPVDLKAIKERTVTKEIRLGEEVQGTNTTEVEVVVITTLINAVLGVSRMHLLDSSSSSSSRSFINRLGHHNTFCITSSLLEMKAVFILSIRSSNKI